MYFKTEHIKQKHPYFMKNISYLPEKLNIYFILPLIAHIIIIVNIQLWMESYKTMLSNAKGQKLAKWECVCKIEVCSLTYGYESITAVHLDGSVLISICITFAAELIIVKLIGLGDVIIGLVAVCIRSKCKNDLVYHCLVTIELSQLSIAWSR